MKRFGENEKRGRCRMANWREFNDLGSLAVVYKTYEVSGVVDTDQIHEVYDLDISLGGTVFGDFIDAYGARAFEEYRETVTWGSVHPDSEFYTELRSTV